MISVVLRSTIIQVATPDAYRGRVNAAEIMVGGNVPQVGNFRAGVVAELTSPGVSAGLGGVLAVVGAAGIALAMPAVVRYRTADVPSRAGDLTAQRGPTSASMSDCAVGLASSSSATWLLVPRSGSSIGTRTSDSRPTSKITESQDAAATAVP